MIDHMPWITKLASDCAVLGGRVYDGAQYPHDKFTWSASDVPVAYVYPYGDMPSEAESGATARRQQIALTVDVIIVVSATLVSGKWYFDTLRDTRTAISGTIMGSGWVPTGAIMGPLYSGGFATDLDARDDEGTYLIWTDRYRCNYLSNY